MQLTRSRIIARTIDLIEVHGVEAVSMYRLATELGCSVMCLYSYVPSRYSLLEGVADQVMSAAETTQMPGASWQERLHTQASAFRRAATAHPRCAMLAMSGRPASARMARQAETALAALREAGFADQAAAGILRALLAFTIGSIVREARVAPGLPEDEAVTGARRWVSAALQARDPEADFDFGLTLLLQAVAASQQILCTHPWGSGNRPN
jgi:AcrR family transcriptional regulator